MSAYSHRSAKVYGLCLLSILLSSLTACRESSRTRSGIEGGHTMQTPISSWSRPGPNLTKATALEAFKAAPEEYIAYAADNTMTITFTCSIFEGLFCWMKHQQSEEYFSFSDDLAKKIINEIDARRIEQVTGNQIQLRCTKPIDADDPLYCQVKPHSFTDWVDYPLRD